MGFTAYQSARSELRAGRFGRAQRQLNALLATDPEPELRARCLVSLALVAAELGSVGDGMALCAQALAIPELPTEVRGLAHAQRALLAVRMGDRLQALRAFAAAEPLLAAHPEELTSLYLNRGLLELNSERAAAAREDFLAAILLVETQLAELEAADGGDSTALGEARVLRAKATFNLGMAEAVAGNLVAALRHLEAVAPVLNPLSRNYEAVGESCLGEILAASGLVAEAAEKFDRAARIFGEEGLRQDQAELELLWAQLMSRADPAASRRTARRAAHRFRRRGAQDWVIRAEIAYLGAMGGRAQYRLALAERLYAEATRRRLRHEAATCALYAATATAQVGAGVGAGDSAGRWLRRARRRPDEPVWLRLHRAQATAAVALARGDRRAALRILRAGLTELHEWLSGFGSAELQAALMGRGEELVAAGLRLAAESEDPALLFEWSERARVLVSRVSRVRAPGDAEAAAALEELRTLGVGRAELDDSPAASATGAGAPGSGSSAARAAELRELIRRQSWYAPAIGPSAQPVRLAELRRRLAETGKADGLTEAGLLSLIAAEGELLALWVTPAGTGVRRLGPLTAVTARLAALRADLDMAAGLLPDPLAASVRASLTRGLAELDDRLLAPLREVLPTRERWVLVPTAKVAAVPWALLPSLHGVVVTVARSATHWSTEASRSETLAQRGLTSVGLVSGPQVERAAAEIRAAGAEWPPGRARVRELAPAAVVSALAEEVDVLHLAAHGRHAAEQPLFSGVSLQDGSWFGYDVEQLRRVPSVVILSACELGRSQVRAGEQLLGMTTAWLHAGARCVIASPVLVSDEAAGELLPLVHRGLAEGAPPAVALARAHAATEVVAPFNCFGSGW